MEAFGVKYDRERRAGDIGYKPRIIAGTYKKVWNNGYIEYYNQYPQDLTILDGDKLLSRDQLHPGPPYKEGGPFFLYHSCIPGRDIQGNCSLSRRVTYSPTSWYEWSYVGGFYPMSWPYPSLGTNWTSSTLINAGDSGVISGSYGDASSLGPEAWNRFRPRVSVADLGQFFGEIREVPRMLKTSARYFKDLWVATAGKQSKARFIKPGVLADQWLNTQFGWVPCVSDIMKVITTLSSVESRMTRFKERNGIYFKRGGPIDSIPLTRTLIDQKTSTVAPTYFAPGIGNQLMFAYSTNMYLETSIDTWFEGLFKYYIPSLASSDLTPWSPIQNYLRAYGIRVTPLLVWNLTPWSWLADWVGNIGDNIANFTAQQYDNLTAKYAFIMQTKVNNLVNESICYHRMGVSEMKWKLGITTKSRRAAPPFGFSFTVPDFSARQWSILAALGYSRLHIEQFNTRYGF